MRRCDSPHLLERFIQVSIVEFVVSTDVNDGAVERLVCPLHTPTFDTDVSRQNNYISIRGRRCEVFEFGM